MGLEEGYFWPIAAIICSVIRDEVLLAMEERCLIVQRRGAGLVRGQS